MTISSFFIHYFEPNYKQIPDWQRKVKIVSYFTIVAPLFIVIGKLFIWSYNSLKGRIFHEKEKNVIHSKVEIVFDRTIQSQTPPIQSPLILESEEPKHFFDSRTVAETELRDIGKWLIYSPIEEYVVEAFCVIAPENHDRKPAIAKELKTRVMENLKAKNYKTSKDVIQYIHEEALLARLKIDQIDPHKFKKACLFAKELHKKHVEDLKIDYPLPKSGLLSDEKSMLRKLVLDTLNVDLKVYLKDFIVNRIREFIDLREGFDEKTYQIMYRGILTHEKDMDLFLKEWICSYQKFLNFINKWEKNLKKELVQKYILNEHLDGACYSICLNTCDGVYRGKPINEIIENTKLDKKVLYEQVMYVLSRNLFRNNGYDEISSKALEQFFRWDLLKKSGFTSHIEIAVKELLETVKSIDQKNFSDEKSNYKSVLINQLTTFLNDKNREASIGQYLGEWIRTLGRFTTFSSEKVKKQEKHVLDSRGYTYYQSDELPNNANFSDILGRVPEARGVVFNIRGLAGGHSCALIRNKPDQVFTFFDANFGFYSFDDNDQLSEFMNDFQIAICPRMSLVQEFQFFN